MARKLAQAVKFTPAGGMSGFQEATAAPPPTRLDAGHIDDDGDDD